MKLPKRHMISEGISFYLYVVVAIACVAGSFWPPYSPYWPMIAFRVMVLLGGIFLGWYFFIKKNFGAKFCGSWVYRGPIVRNGQDWRVCSGCGECQRYLGSSRSDKRGLTHRSVGNDWLTITLDEMDNEIKRAEEFAKSDRKQQEKAAREEAKRMQKEAQEQAKRAKALEDSRKKALEWVRATAGYGNHMASEEKPT